MALQSVKYGFPFPTWPSGVAAAPSLSTMAITSAAHKAAAIWTASAAKNIHKIHFRLGTTTTGDTVDCRVETVDSASNGDPTGTLWATNTNGSNVVASSDDAVWKSATLTADATLAKGDVFALVVANGGGGGSMQFNTFGDAGFLFPYGDLFTASWAKSANLPLIVPEYSDGSFEPIFGYQDVGPVNANSFNSGSTTNRRGNRFSLAFPARANGCWAWVDADGDFTIKLYDTDGTSVLATTATINTVQRQGAGPGVQCYPFTTTADLTANGVYRVAVVPSTVTNVIVYDFDVPVAGMLDMFPGGQDCHASILTSAVWAQTTTRRGWIGVMLDAFADDTGGGGGSAGGARIIGGTVLR